MKKSTGFRVTAMVLSYLLTVLIIVSVVVSSISDLVPSVWLIIMGMVAICVLVSIPNGVSVLIGSIISGLMTLLFLISMFDSLPYYGIFFDQETVTGLTLVFIGIIVILLLTFIFSLIAAIRLLGKKKMSGQPYGQYPYGQQPPYGQQSYQQPPYQQPCQPPYTPPQPQQAPAPQPQPSEQPQAAPAQQPPANCPSCGTALKPGARFCTHCGAQIPSAK